MRIPPQQRDDQHREDARHERHRGRHDHQGRGGGRPTGTARTRRPHAPAPRARAAGGAGRGRPRRGNRRAPHRGARARARCGAGGRRTRAPRRGGARRVRRPGGERRGARKGDGGHRRVLCGLRPETENLATINGRKRTVQTRGACSRFAFREHDDDDDGGVRAGTAARSSGLSSFFTYRTASYRDERRTNGSPRRYRRAFEWSLFFFMVPSLVRLPLPHRVVTSESEDAGTAALAAVYSHHTRRAHGPRDARDWMTHQKQSPRAPRSSTSSPVSLSTRPGDDTHTADIPRAALRHLLGTFGGLRVLLAPAPRHVVRLPEPQRARGRSDTCGGYDATARSARFAAARARRGGGGDAGAVVLAVWEIAAMCCASPLASAAVGPRRRR